MGADRLWCMRVVNGNEWEECTLDEALAMGPRACAGRWSGGLMAMVFECQT